VIERGEHRVVLTFQPESLHRGVQLTAGGLALTGVMTFLLWPRRARALQYEAT